MTYQILSIVLGLCFFVVPLLAYRRGLKDGLNIQQGKQPEPIKSPVQHIRDRKEQKEAEKEQDMMMEGLQNILSYDGEPQEVGDD